MTLPRDEPEGMLSSQAKVVLGAALAIGLQLGLFQAFMLGRFDPVFSSMAGAFVFGLVALLLWQRIFPLLRRVPRGRRTFAQVLIAIAFITPTSFLLVNGIGWIGGVPTMFNPYGGEDIAITVAASQLRIAPLVFFLLPIIPSVLLIVVGFNQSWWQIFVLRRRESQARQLVAAAELDALRAQINPHFLFNSLNSIAQLIGTEPDRAEKCVERLAEIFRYILHSDNRAFVTLDDELGIVDAYLDIERARFGDNLLVRYEIDDAVRNHSVPTLILQPLIENAVRHGISKKIGGGTVSVHAALSGDDLKIVVHDTGIGMKDTLADSLEVGVGLRNVHDRLVFLFGEEYAPQIESSPGQGTTIELRLPPGVEATKDKAMLH